MAFGGLNPQSILIGMTIMVLLVVVIIAFASLFLAQFSSQLSVLGNSGTNVNGALATIASGQSAINGIPGWLPIIILAFILLVVLGIIAVVAMVAWRMQGGAQQ